jgi:adenylate kinase family enzyme
MNFNNLYENFLSLYTEGVYDPHIFKAIFMVGPMGAGKSTVAQKLVGVGIKEIRDEEGKVIDTKRTQQTGLRSLNLDNFNEMFIKKAQPEGGILPASQLEKSWQNVQKQKANYLDGRLGLLIDGSGRNMADVFENLRKLLKLGYDVACIFVNITADESVLRAKKRAAKQAEEAKAKAEAEAKAKGLPFPDEAKQYVGRNINEPYQRATHAQVQKNLPKFQQLFKDNFFYVDNTKVPNLEEVQKRVNRFLATPPSKPAALQWIAQQKEQRKKSFNL